MGSPSRDQLEGVAREIKDWKSLGRRLQFEESQLTGFDKKNEPGSEKAFAMLMSWKGRDGSAATYRVLHDALCHEYGELFSNDILRARFSL